METKLITKEAIKQVLNAGGTISVSYKTEINQWYGELKISKLNDYFVVQPYWTKFYDIDEAINYFCSEAFTSKNVGYTQSRLDKKGIDFEKNYDLENPNDKLKELFRKEGQLVDEEAKALNIVLKPFPDYKNALEEFDALIKYINPNNLVEKLKLFEKKYCTLDPYLNLSYYYDYKEEDGSIHDYSIGVNYNNFTHDRLNSAKKERGHNNCLTFQKLKLTLKLGCDKDYHWYDLKL